VIPLSTARYIASVQVCALLSICCLAGEALAASTAIPDSVPPASQINSGSVTPSVVNSELNRTVNLDSVHKRFSLNACFDRAGNDNKEILVAAAALPLAQAAITIAKALPNPTYSVVYGFGPAWSYIVAGNNQQFGFTEEILVAGKRTKRTNVAKATYIQQIFQLEAVRFDVHNRVRRAYAELAAATAYAELIETQREIATNLLDVSSKRVEAGKAPGAEAIQARLNVMQFETQRNSAQGRLMQDSTALSLLLGEIPKKLEIIDVDENVLFKIKTGKATLVPAPERGVPRLDDLLPAAWKERNDLKASIQQAYAQQKRVTLAKSLRVPDPFIGFNYLFSTYKHFQPQYFDPDNSGQNTPGNQVPNQPGYLLTYAQEAPIYYQYQGQIAQAKATAEQQLTQVELNKTQIASAITSAYEAIRMHRDNIEKFQQELLPSAEKMAQLARRSYELGKTDLATAILAQQQYQQLRSSYFDSIVSYQNAWADLEKAVGLPLNL
jgi:outer membrane protein, heavy metal efflux system